MATQSTTEGPHIILKRGTIRVEIETVPHLIAEALYPAEQVNGEPTVSYLTKVTPQRPLGDLLTDEDIQLLHSIWAKLPPYQDGMRASEWARYEAAFNGAKRRPAWTLLPVWINPNYNGEGGALMRAQAEAEHQVLLGKALVEGRITGITHAGAPVLSPFIAHGVYVSVRELERYLSTLPLPIALHMDEPGEQVSETPVREDDLAPLIEEVARSIEGDAGTVTPANVYPKLRTLALSKRVPFTGNEIKKRGLAWITASGETRYFDREALRKRLARRDRR